ncbi:putative inactive lipase [Corynebacterium choanae]|uniref:Putative inactive lipase n=2 Tax=Corynebacterium choanae TaxID=1862358 RepID=A0A3G6J9I3_9CORY|nr:putative inactive lipase [Corynebacterium choanae]
MRYWTEIGVPVAYDFFAEIVKESVSASVLHSQSHPLQRVKRWGAAVVGLDQDCEKSQSGVGAGWGFGPFDARSAAALSPAELAEIFGVADLTAPLPALPEDARPGMLLGAEPVRVLGASTVLQSTVAKRLSYVTVTGDGQLVPAAAMVIMHAKPAVGRLRPVVGIAPSTQGVAPHCDPSRSAQVGVRLAQSPGDAVVAYELPALLACLQQGADVVCIDYPRDPATGIQLYGNHAAAGHALIDAIVACNELGVSAAAPVGLWGFSQGGGAVGWVCEHPEIAENLHIAAAVVAAPPVDLLEVAQHIDGGGISGVLVYCMAQLIVTNDAVRAVLLPKLSPTGLQALRQLMSTCATGTVFQSGWRSTTSWTTTGESLAELAMVLPVVREALASLALASASPRWPCHVVTAVHDDVIPAAQVHRLHRKWREGGAPVAFTEHPLVRFPFQTGSNHFLPYFLAMPDLIDWLFAELDRWPHRPDRW